MPIERVSMPFYLFHQIPILYALFKGRIQKKGSFDRDVSVFSSSESEAKIIQSHIQEAQLDLSLLLSVFSIILSSALTEERSYIGF